MASKFAIKTLDNGWVGCRVAQYGDLVDKKVQIVNGPVILFAEGETPPTLLELPDDNAADVALDDRDVAAEFEDWLNGQRRLEDLQVNGI